MHGILKSKGSQCWVETEASERYKVHISEVDRVSGDNLNLEDLEGEIVEFDVDDQICPPSGYTQWVKNSSLRISKNLD